MPPLFICCVYFTLCSLRLFLLLVSLRPRKAPPIDEAIKRNEKRRKSGSEKEFSSKVRNNFMPNEINNRIKQAIPIAAKALLSSKNLIHTNPPIKPDMMSDTTPNESRYLRGSESVLANAEKRRVNIEC